MTHAEDNGVGCALVRVPWDEKKVALEVLYDAFAGGIMEIPVG